MRLGYARQVRACLAIVVALIASGCGGDSGGGPCTRDEACARGEVCNLSAPDAPGMGTCIPDDGDIDGDGLRNDRDFCHGQPGGAYDEDLDLLGDDCDRCPIAPPPATPDADGDELDSPCDPDPGAAGDQVVAFDGFNAPLPETWSMTPGWELRGGEVVATPPEPTEFLTLVAPLPLVTTKLAVLAQYRVDRVDASATQNFAGVTAIDRRPAGVSTVVCGGSRAGGIDSVLLDTDTGASSMRLMNLFDPAGRYRVAERIDGIQSACAMISDTEMTAVQQTTGGEAPTEAGLTVRAATVRFQYLLVIQRSN